MKASKDSTIIVESPSGLLKHYVLQNKIYFHFSYYFNSHFQEGVVMCVCVSLCVCAWAYRCSAGGIEGRSLLVPKEKWHYSYVCCGVATLLS